MKAGAGATERRRGRIGTPVRDMRASAHLGHAERPLSRLKRRHRTGAGAVHALSACVAVTGGCDGDGDGDGDGREVEAVSDPDPPGGPPVPAAAADPARC